MGINFVNPYSLTQKSLENARSPPVMFGNMWWPLKCSPTQLIPLKDLRQKIRWRI